MSMLPSRKKSKQKSKSDRDEEEEIEQLKKELAEEKKGKEEVEWVANELEKHVSEMERNVFQLESGNYDYDDSEIKQKYDNQRQLNIQLQEQKRWLEHELEEIKMKIQNDKQSLMPDAFMLDWDNLSETELKRLVAQLEKTKNDVMLDLRDAQLRMDHEGKEFHHFDYFCQHYRTEILDLNRTLESLVRSGILPQTYHITHMGSSISSSYNGSFPSTGQQTPSNALLSPKKGPLSPRKSAPISPRKVSSGARQQKSSSAGGVGDGQGSNQRSPRRKPKSKVDTNADSQTSNNKNGRAIDPKMGPVRKTAGVRNLPKIERKHGNAGVSQEKKNQNARNDDSDSDDDLESLSNFLSGPSTISTMMTRRSAGGIMDLSELDPVEELPAEHLEDSP